MQINLDLSTHLDDLQERAKGGVMAYPFRKAVTDALERLPCPWVSPKLDHHVGIQLRATDEMLGSHRRG